MHVLSQKEIIDTFFRQILELKIFTSSLSNQIQIFQTTKQT